MDYMEGSFDVALPAPLYAGEALQEMETESPVPPDCDLTRPADGLPSSQRRWIMPCVLLGVVLSSLGSASLEQIGRSGFEACYDRRPICSDGCALMAVIP
jgi:hypothetical protein